MGLTVSFDIFDIEQRPRPIPTLSDSYAYRLSVGDPVRIAAATEWGALAGLATLAQLGADDALEVATVRDEPRFPWRGVMLDTARHFITLATLKRTLDAMWFYKLNVLHLHLTDDQAFRFRSAAFPELASPTAYSTAELADLVAYAADRGVRVIPELDMPGHSTCWLAVHSEWGLDTGDAPAHPSKRFGVHPACLDTGNPALVKAVETLLGELAEAFPDECIHFGGDEVAGLDPEPQHRFHRHVVEYLAGLGKRAVGWDECLSATLPANTVVQCWRGAAGRDVALRAGFDCVVSSPYYLDLFYPAQAHYEADPAGDLMAAEAALRRNPRLAHVEQGLAWMENFASFPELGPELAPTAWGRVLGGEACLWTELVADELVDTRLWSRMPAIAERLWSVDADSTPGHEDFYRRMAETRLVLARMGVVREDTAAFDAYPALKPLIEMLEPVKWYRRLLGEAELARRVSGLGGSAAERPYDVDTPLDRIVDRIAPESLASRRAEADLAAGAPMHEWVAGWRAQYAALAGFPELFDELGRASTALAALADIVDGKSSADPASCAGPFGEYLLPVAYAFGRAPR